MDYNSLTTVKEISDCVKEKIDAYRRIPEKMESEERDRIMRELLYIFDPKSETCSRVVKDGTFAAAFSAVMGKRRMKVLKKILCESYPRFYNAIVF